MSSVTTIDPQPNNSYGDSADTAHCDKNPTCCESGEQCEQTSRAKMDPNDSANLNGHLSGRRKWLSLAAVSAAITFMLAPFCVGAFQRSATTKTQATTLTGQAELPTVSRTIDSPTPGEDTIGADLGSEISVASSSHSAPPSINRHTENPFGTNYVALREPTEEGDRIRIVVFEPNRDVYIHENEQDGIQVRVRRYLFGTSTEQMVSGSDIEDLKEQSAEAFELYSAHIGKANLLGPMVSIYPAEEVAWLQPSGFLTAMSIDETKKSAKKSSDKKKTASEKKENSKLATPKKETLKKNSQKKETSKKEATKKSKNSPTPASPKDSTKPKPTKNTKKDNTSNGTTKKMSTKMEDSKKNDTKNDTKKKNMPNKKESKESSSKKSTSQRDTAMKSKSEKQAGKKAKTEQTQSKVAKSRKEAPNKKSTAKKESKPGTKSKSEPNKKSVLQRPVNDPAEMPQLATESFHTEVGKDV